jgi:activating signal cointegrator 1
MKAISLWQPWASGLVDGRKKHETRSWSTRHRGPLAIHASLTVDGEGAARITPETTSFPVGAILGVVDLAGVFRMTQAIIDTQTELERAWGDWRPNRFAWTLRPIVWLDEPIPAKGKQGLWEWDETQHPHVAAAVEMWRRGARA